MLNVDFSNSLFWFPEITRYTLKARSYTSKNSSFFKVKINSRRQIFWTPAYFKTRFLYQNATIMHFLHAAGNIDPLYPWSTHWFEALKYGDVPRSSTGSSPRPRVQTTLPTGSRVVSEFRPQQRRLPQCAAQRDQVSRAGGLRCKADVQRRDRISGAR